MNFVCCFISNLFVCCFIQTCKCIYNGCNNDDLGDESPSTQLINIDSIINTYEKDDEDVVICPITQEEILYGETINELRCGHKFSENISKWVSSNNMCPVCREKVIDI